MFQEEIYLHKLQGCHARNRVLTPFASIGKLVGYLEFTPEKPLSPAGRFFQREIVGSVRAGFPSPASEGLTDTISIDEYLVEQPSVSGRRIEAFLGEITSSKEMLAAHLTYHTTRLAMELVTKRYLAGRLSVFVRLKSFESAVLEVRLPYPTESYFTLMRWVSQLLEQLYKPDQLYRGCDQSQVR